MINEIIVTPAAQEFRLTGVSEIAGLVDEFQVSAELRDRVIGWVRMRWVLIMELEGRLQMYDQEADDLTGSPLHREIPSNTPFVDRMFTGLLTMTSGGSSPECFGTMV